MPEVVPFVLWSWLPLTLLLFWRLPARKAAVASLVGGWLLLPTARFLDDVAGVDFPYWIMPSALPSDYWTTKGRVIGIALLLGVVTFDPRAWTRFRPSWLDLPILGWCLCPIASDLSNGLKVTEALADSAYLALTWGVPYLVGRLYFADPAGLDVLARALIIGALAYAPFCLVESVTGPIFYRTLYGFHPYAAQGMTRYLGYRPVVFLEDGNQLGVWMATAALVSVWLWRSGSLRRLGKIPGGVVAGGLTALAILTQSAGAVILLFLGLASIEVVRRVDRRWPIVAVLAIPLLFVGARAAHLFDAKALVMGSSLGRKLAESSIKLDRKSFGWRLQVEERASKLALQRPLMGWARWDWWRDATRGERPWGLFSLSLGAYGVIGWLLLMATFAAPIAAFLNLGPPRFWITSTRASATALAGALALNELDAILNANFLLPMLAASGALVGLRMHAKAASAWVQKVQGKFGGLS